MASCNHCFKEGSQQLYLRGHYGQIIRHELGLQPDAALCDDCWGAITWAFRQHWIAEGKHEAKRMFNDCDCDT